MSTDPWRSMESAPTIEPTLFPGTTGDRKPQTPRSERPLFGIPCDLGLCGFITNGNDVALWGECPVCGAVAGYITRDVVHSYLEREEAARRAKKPLLAPPEGEP